MTLQKTGCIAITNEYGIVVRVGSLSERGVALKDLLTALGVAAPFDVNDQVMSFGPHFGKDALDEFIRRLSELGLQYYDDFFEFSGDFPDWCTFKACLSSPRSRV